MASWLESLPTADSEGEDHAADVAVEPDIQAPDADPAEASRSWLEAAGFDPKDVREALAEAEDEDEAFARLQKRQLAAQEARLRPSKRGFEVDGYCCTADANPKRIRLLLPALDLAGPVVGRIQKDGSMTVEIDEWAQELYFASLPRAVVPSDTTFRREEVDLALSQRRPYIWEDFATTEEVKKAHSELEALRERGVLTSANSDTTGKQKARSDKVGFLEIRRDASSPQCMKLFHRMEAAVGTLSWSDGGPLLCPKFGMAAVYDGAGSFYAAHRDNEHHSGEAKWVNFRSLTAVMYINPSGFQSAEDGGSLRCFVDAAASDLTGASAKEIQDVNPRGGRAVLFPSRSLLHEVLPSFRRRYALTLWFVSPNAGE